VPVGDDTVAYRRGLPHLSKTGKTYFITFVTQFRFSLPECIRHLVLESCSHDHRELHWFHAPLVMPDHVPLVLPPYEATLSAILQRIKSASAYKVNRTGAGPMMPAPAESRRPHRSRGPFPRFVTQREGDAPHGGVVAVTPELDEARWIGIDLRV